MKVLDSVSITTNPGLKDIGLLSTILTSSSDNEVAKGLVGLPKLEVESKQLVRVRFDTKGVRVELVLSLDESVLVLSLDESVLSLDPQLPGSSV